MRQVFHLFYSIVVAVIIDFHLLYEYQYEYEYEFSFSFFLYSFRLPLFTCRTVRNVKRNGSALFEKDPNHSTYFVFIWVKSRHGESFSER